MKSVFVGATVGAAVASARKELGGDAYLMEVSPIGVDAGGGYRVVFALNPSGEVGTGQGPNEYAVGRRGPGDEGPEAHPLGPLAPVAWSRTAKTNSRDQPARTLIAALLQDFDLPLDQAQQTLDRLEQRLAAEQRAPAVRRLLAQELEAMVTFDSGVISSANRTIVALVGPAGGGKTATLVKLAIRLGVSAGRSTVVLTTDTRRVGSEDQLRRYAGVLGVPFQTIDSPPALSAALAEHAQAELILIDTPGFGARDWDAASEWAGVLRADRELRTQLVLPATMRATDAREAARRWAIFQPDRLIFTRLDETSAYGGCVGAAMELGKPLSWFGVGQEIPDDLERASARRIFDALLARGLKTKVAVA